MSFGPEGYIFAAKAQNPSIYERLKLETRDGPGFQVSLIKNQRFKI
jgi:hypothetical protein